MPFVQSRRRFLTNAAVAGAAGLGGFGAASLGSGRKSFAAEPPPEVTAIRLDRVWPTCVAPEYVAQELLHAEGFTDVRYEPVDLSPPNWAARDEQRWTIDFAARLITDMEVGGPITVVAGVHVGCFEVFAHEAIRSFTDLKGRTVAARRTGPSTQLMRIMASNVGLNPDKDINWLSFDPPTDPMDLFIDRKIDAFFTAAPGPQELRVRNIGHSIVNSATDRPWSQYFCCMLAGNSEFVRKYPVATKRVVRAIMKATDICATEPERVARLMVDRGFTARYDYALQALKELPYGVWRDYDVEDTMRFYALRLNEAGFIKSSPQKLIAEHTNWRFLNEVKRELKT